MFNDAYLSRERTIFVCYQFFKQLRNRYGRKPIFTDGAHWYNDACRWLRLDHRESMVLNWPTLIIIHFQEIDKFVIIIA
jgi:transposase-like protein